MIFRLFVDMQGIHRMTVCILNHFLFCLQITIFNFCLFVVAAVHFARDLPSLSSMMLSLSGEVSLGSYHLE